MPKKGEQEIVVLGFQGNVSEHVEAICRTLNRLSIQGRAKAATDASSIRHATALAIPGGESTTISKLIASKGLKEEIVALASSGRPMIGTCAGLILLSKSVSGRDTSKDPGFPSVLNASVARNAFGRQRESFETEVEIKLPQCTLREVGIFIRAPAIEATAGECVPVGWVEDRIVAVLQGNILGTCFHPELTEDSRIYEFLLRKVGLSG